MKARAPGKLVMSGAYAVLEGAPALATAVDRYAVADTERAPDRYSREVLAVLSQAEAPFVKLLQETSINSTRLPVSR